MALPFESRRFFLKGSFSNILEKNATVETVNLYAVGCGVLSGTCNNRTMVPHKEFQWHNGTPQEKF